MPNSQSILEGLGAIANEYRFLAIAWHAVFGLCLTALALGLRPSRRLAGVLLAVPAASVSALAWLKGNPFNGTVFALLAVALGAQAVRLAPEPVRFGGAWRFGAGALLVSFGWSYPHFLETETWTSYLYAAPLGLIPCPTLSALVGAALMLDGFAIRGWPLVLAAGGTLYGLIGWLRLGVTMDLVLLAGAVLLGLTAVRPVRVGERSIPGWS